MLDWNDYRDELKTRIGEVGKLSPDTVRGYATLSGAGAKTGHLDAKTRELIALAVAVTTRCDGCITVHVDAALKQGASREERSEEHTSELQSLMRISYAVFCLKKKKRTT